MHQDDVQFLALGDALRQDERGFVYFPFQYPLAVSPSLEMLTSCHIISILPSQMRGQHQHPYKTEWLYVFHGQGLFFWRDRDNYLQKRLLDGNHTLVVIPPGIPHTLRNEGPDSLYLLSWRVTRGPDQDEPDTVPALLV